jgi:hypothetical protein
MAVDWFELIGRAEQLHVGVDHEHRFALPTWRVGGHGLAPSMVLQSRPLRLHGRSRGSAFAGR